MDQQFILDQLFWIRSGSIAQWAAAGGQLLTALMLVAIAYKTFSYSRSSINATVTKHFNDMVNEWNKMVIHSEETMKITTEMRKPILGQPHDSLVFTYLNFLHTTFVMRHEKLITKDQEDTTMKNGVSWLATMSRDQLERFLSRGYEPEFRRRIIVEYEALSK